MGAHCRDCRVFALTQAHTHARPFLPRGAKKNDDYNNTTCTVIHFVEHRTDGCCFVCVEHGPCKRRVCLSTLYDRQGPLAVPYRHAHRVEKLTCRLIVVSSSAVARRSHSTHAGALQPGPQLVEPACAPPLPRPIIADRKPFCSRSIERFLLLRACTGCTNRVQCGSCDSPA